MGWEIKGHREVFVVRTWRDLGRLAWSWFALLLLAAMAVAVVAAIIGGMVVATERIS
jgi:hypothetical protein